MRAGSRPRHPPARADRPGPSHGTPGFTDACLRQGGTARSSSSGRPIWRAGWPRRGRRARGDRSPSKENTADRRDPEGPARGSQAVELAEVRAHRSNSAITCRRRRRGSARRRGAGRGTRCAEPRGTRAPLRRRRRPGRSGRSVVGCPSKVASVRSNSWSTSEAKCSSSVSILRRRMSSSIIGPLGRVRRRVGHERSRDTAGPWTRRRIRRTPASINLRRRYRWAIPPPAGRPCQRRPSVAFGRVDGMRLPDSVREVVGARGGRSARGDECSPPDTGLGRPSSGASGSSPRDADRCESAFSRDRSSQRGPRLGARGPTRSARSRSAVTIRPGPGAGPIVSSPSRARAPLTVA